MPLDLQKPRAPRSRVPEAAHPLKLTATQMLVIQGLGMELADLTTTALARMCRVPLANCYTALSRLRACGFVATKKVPRRVADGRLLNGADNRLTEYGALIASVLEKNRRELGPKGMAWLGLPTLRVRK
jgi:hypothetical protein